MSEHFYYTTFDTDSYEDLKDIHNSIKAREKQIQKDNEHKARMEKFASDTAEAANRAAQSAENAEFWSMYNAYLNEKNGKK